MDEELEKVEKLIDRYNTELLMHIKVILCHAIKEAIELELDPIKKFIHIKKTYNEIIDSLIDYTENNDPLPRQIKDKIYDDIIEVYENEAMERVYEMIDELYNSPTTDDPIEFDKKYQELLEIINDISTTGEGLDALHDIPIKSRQSNQYTKK